MRAPDVLLVADMRSPHSVSWVLGLQRLGIDVLVVSSRRLDRRTRAGLPAGVAGVIVHEPRDLVSRSREVLTRLPAILRLARRLARGTGAAPTARRETRPEGVGRVELPLELVIATLLGRRVRALVRRTGPRAVHALRIPYEGIAAAGAAGPARFVVSIWGQDLVRQAPSSPALAARTRATLARADAVHADCRRDAELAREWGARPGVLDLVAPGTMGFDPRTFTREGAAEPGDRRLIVLPRGPAVGIDYIGFVAVAAELVDRYPDAVFVGVRLRGEPTCEELRARSSDPERIVLTGSLSQPELATLYREAVAVVSPSVNDGTPNSVLEGMACGAVPVVGDIAPLRDLLGPELAEGLIPPFDRERLRAALERVVELDAPARRELGARAAERAGGWSADVTAHRVREWYGLILGADRVPAP